MKLQLGHTKQSEAFLAVKILKEDAHKKGGYMYEHELEDGQKCDVCKFGWEDADKFYSFAGDIFCENCFQKETQVCKLCDKRFYNEYIENGVCDDCTGNKRHLRTFLIDAKVAIDRVNEMYRANVMLDKTYSEKEMLEKLCLAEAQIKHAIKVVGVSYEKK
jgi:hypothetical protein